MSEETKWWYELDNVQKGSVTENEIINLINNGVIKPDNLVWQQGYETWIMLKNSTLSKYLESEDLRQIKETTTIESIDKWYNNKSKLGLSLLFFPIFLYGVYKTSLFESRIKYIIYGVFAVIWICGAFGDNTNTNRGYNYSSDGPRQSGWDHSVDCVVTYLKTQYLRDPDSYEGIHWSIVEKNSDGTYYVTHTFRAKNGFGGMGEQTMTFTIASDGHTILSTY